MSHYALHSPENACTASIDESSSWPRGTKHHNQKYAAMTYDLDRALGMLIQELNKLNLENSTYLFFMSDNGAGSGPRSKENAPLNGTKGTLYEGGIRVPLIIKGPGIKPGTFCSQNVIGYDLFPTWAALAGIDNRLPEHLEGSNLLPLLKNGGKNNEFRPRIKELIFHYPHYGMGPRQVPVSALIVDEKKIIKFWETGKTLLFDLHEDIAETRNIADLKKEECKRLDNMLMNYLKTVGAQIPRKNPDYNPEASRPSGRRKKGGWRPHR